MPLPERPNVGEFIPTIEPSAPKRVAFRWRVVPIAMLSIPALVSGMAAVAMAIGLAMTNPFQILFEQPTYINKAQTFERNVVVLGGLLCVLLGLTAVTLLSGFAIWHFHKGAWRWGLGLCALIGLVGALAPGLVFVLPWLARTLAGILYPCQSLD
jgi:hypothetical protein